MTLEPYDRVMATFQPDRTDDLQNNADKFLGVRCEWRVLWMVTEEDGGSYVGQWALNPADFDIQRKYGSSFVWVPLCDLKDVVKLELCPDCGATLEMVSVPYGSPWVCLKCIDAALKGTK